MGYAGGQTPRPTYHNLADHAEAVRLVFDPSVLRFETLLRMFWAGHDPTYGLPGSQYRAELFCQDERQRELAEVSRAELTERLRTPVATAVRIGAPFHPAEAYHQKWRLRRQPDLWAELEGYYRSEPELLASTSAAKLNAYVGGYGTPEQLDRDVPLLGLSADAGDRLRSLAS